MPTSLVVGSLLIQLVIMAADPFSLYPWSPPRRVLEENNSPGLAPYLFRVVARGDHDAVVLGGSTTLLLDGRYVEALFQG